MHSSGVEELWSVEKKIMPTRRRQKVKKNGEKCRKFFFHAKAKLESATMVRATRKKLT
jgi:hypothetical protein